MSTRTAGRSLGVIALIAALAGCSSTGSSPAAGVTTSRDRAPTRVSASAQHYLNAVNALCDALLPKIIKLPRGGSIDVPADQYLATWPAHERLLSGFDVHLAAIPVPVAARGQAAKLSAYVHFADELDAARLAAARDGEASYAKEVTAESNVEDDPRITTLATAGFNNSCKAR